MLCKVLGLQQVQADRTLDVPPRAELLQMLVQSCIRQDCSAIQAKKRHIVRGRKAARVLEEKTKHSMTEPSEVLSSKLSDPLQGVCNYRYDVATLHTEPSQATRDFARFFRWRFLLMVLIIACAAANNVILAAADSFAEAGWPLESQRVVRRILSAIMYLLSVGLCVYWFRVTAICSDYSNKDVLMYLAIFFSALLAAHAVVCAWLFSRFPFWTVFWNPLWPV
jgi:cation transport ATPase